MQNPDGKDTDLVGTSGFQQWSSRGGDFRRVTEEDANPSCASRDGQRSSSPSARIQVSQPPDEAEGASGTLRCPPAIAEHRELAASFVVGASGAERPFSPLVERRPRPVSDEEETDFGDLSVGFERLSRRDYDAGSSRATRSPIRTSVSPVVIDRSFSALPQLLQPHLPPVLRESPDAAEGSKQRHRKRFSNCSGGQLYVNDESSYGVGSHPPQEVSRRRHYRTYSNSSFGVLEEIQQSFHEVEIDLSDSLDTYPPMPFDLLCESPSTPYSDSVIDAAALRLGAMTAAARRRATTQKVIREMSWGAEGSSSDRDEDTSEENRSRTCSSSSTEGTVSHVQTAELDEERGGVPAWQRLMPVQAIDSRAFRDPTASDAGFGRGTDIERPRACSRSTFYFAIAYVTLITFIIFVTIVVFHNTGAHHISPSQTPPVTSKPPPGANFYQMPPLGNRVLL